MPRMRMRVVPLADIVGGEHSRSQYLRLASRIVPGGRSRLGTRAEVVLPLRGGDPWDLDRERVAISILGGQVPEYALLHGALMHVARTGEPLPPP